MNSDKNFRISATIATFTPTTQTSCKDAGHSDCRVKGCDFGGSWNPDQVSSTGKGVPSKRAEKIVCLSMTIN